MERPTVLGVLISHEQRENKHFVTIIFRWRRSSQLQLQGRSPNKSWQITNFQERKKSSASPLKWGVKVKFFKRGKLFSKPTEAGVTRSLAYRCTIKPWSTSINVAESDIRYSKSNVSSQVHSRILYYWEQHQISIQAKTISCKQWIKQAHWIIQDPNYSLVKWYST